MKTLIPLAILIGLAQPATAQSSYEDPVLVEIASMRILYGQTIVWGKASFSVNGCLTPEEARQKAIEMAKQAGWTNPRWWQFWRAGDTWFADINS